MIQSCTMKLLRGFPLLTMGLVVGLASPAMASDHTPPPVQPASSFAAVEVRDNERVAIAAEPYEPKEQAGFFGVVYFGQGVRRVRLIVTNNGEKPISLRDARILF